MVGRRTSALACLAVAAAVLAVVSTVSPVFLAAPGCRRVEQPRPHPATPAEPQGSAVVAGAAAVFVGLAIGLAAGPQMAAAGVTRPLPDFSITRPEYMQGIDASNSAWKPGEIDYVTRSQIEWLQLPKAREEASVAEERLMNAESKEERVQRLMEQARAFVAEADMRV